MPTQVVDVDLRTETGAIPQATFSDLLIVARDPQTVDPTYNEPIVFDTASQVAAEFGTDSDAHVAAQEVEARGADHFWVVCLDTTSHTESGLNDSASTAVNEAQVSNTPMLGGEDNITVNYDGNNDVPLTFSTMSPPNSPDTGAAVNVDTGEVVLNEDTSGADSGIEVEYSTTSFEDAEAEISEGDFDLTILADTRADRSYIGELDQLLSWSSNNNASVVVAYGNGNDYPDEEAAMDAAHETGAYLTSGNVLPIAHKSDDDVAAGIAGRLATKNPWFNPYMDGGADYGFAMDSYRRSIIGSPDQPGTFEGGDDSGAGPVNVLYREMGTQLLSNSLTTAGADSSYQFFDVARTESFVDHEVKAALRELRFQRDQIPFAPLGRTLIEAKLRDRLNQYVSPTGRALSPEEINRLNQNEGESGENGDSQDGPVFLNDPRRTSDASTDAPLSELELHVPRYDDLSQNDRANRVWSGITVNATLAGNVHTFSVELTLLV